MHDHNLDDLIIDTVAPKSNKAKSFLTIVALFIVIIIVMIILNKTFINPDQGNAQILDEELTTTIAPELKLQETVPDVVAKPDEPIESEKPVVEVNEAPSVSTIIEEKVTEEKVAEAVEPAPSLEPKIEKPVEVSAPEVPSTQVPVPSPPEPVASKPVEAQKAAEAVVIPVTQTAAPVPTAVPQVNYFVQVGSYRNKPSPSLLRRIKNNGFTYRLTAPNNNGIKKLLIGPYATRAEVDKALAVVRDRLVKQAFVVKK